MQCTLSYLHDLNTTFHAQDSRMYFRHMAIFKHQTCMLAYLHAVVLLCGTQVKSISSLVHQQDWSNDATSYDAGLALTLLSSSKAMSC